MTTKKQFLDQVRKASRLANKHEEESKKAYDMLVDLIGEENTITVTDNDEFGFVDAVDYGRGTMTEADLDELLTYYNISS